MGAGFLVGVIGVLILSHAAYSTVQYRALLKITEEEFSGPPINVVMELIVSLVLCLWAALAAPGKFKSIHPQSEENRSFGWNSIVKENSYSRPQLVWTEAQWVVALPANLDFMIFNHRGKIFPLEADLKLK
ncbi:membrane magnesium transporter isoform X1 [Nicotiana tomentosiformis]|uniref:membrane magnesium transporter isoform X1 n=1 Tax=Nicotiana tomentosiformis TaxID=4098 RepID=UPI000877F005